MFKLHDWFFAIVIASSFCLTVGAIECPDADRDQYFNGRCFAYFETPAVRHYDDAQQYCHGIGKTLAAPRDPAELLYFANAIEANGWQSALIGLRFSRTAWRWVADGTHLRGQGCNEQITIDTSAMLGQPIFSQSLSSRKCIETCRTDSEAQYAAVMMGSMCYCASAWIWTARSSQCSLPCSGAPDEKCGSTLNSLAFSLEPEAFDNWFPGSPGAAGSCTSVKINHSTNRWIDASCNLALPFICRFDAGTAGTNFEAINAAGTVAASFCREDSCLYLFASPQLIWTEADRFCLKLGGRLAKIESADRQGDLNTLLAGNQVVQTDAWIGATNSLWTFESDRSLLSPSFRGWINVLEPVTPEQNQCAAMVLQSDGSYGWKSKSCTALGDVWNRFVCESLPVGNVTRPPTTKLTTKLTPTTSKPVVRSSTAVASVEGNSDVEGGQAFTTAEPGDEETTWPDEEFTLPGQTFPTAPHRTKPVIRSTRRRAQQPTLPPGSIGEGQLPTTRTYIGSDGLPVVATPVPTAGLGSNLLTTRKLGGVNIRVLGESDYSEETSSGATSNTTISNMVPSTAGTSSTLVPTAQAQQNQETSTEGSAHRISSTQGERFASSQAGHTQRDSVPHVSPHSDGGGEATLRVGSADAQRNDPNLALNLHLSTLHGVGNYDRFVTSVTQSSTLNSSSLTWWAILLIVVGALAVVGIAIGVAIYFMKRKQSTARISSVDHEKVLNASDSTSEISSTDQKKAPIDEKLPASARSKGKSAVVAPSPTSVAPGGVET